MTSVDKGGPPPIEVRGLRKMFRQTTSGQAVVAIDRLDLDIAPREVVAIVGQTGCGKSTFFDLMIGLEAPTEGSLRIGDKSPHADFDFFRGRIATVFQQDRLLPWRSALDNARLPLELIGMPEGEQRERALAWLNRLGLGHFTNAFPHELSGGMRQRVAIARTLILQPKIILMDEPFGALDPPTRTRMQDNLVELWREESPTIFFITHSVEEAVFLGDHILLFSSSPGTVLKTIRVPPPDRPSIVMQRDPHFQEIVTEIRDTIDKLESSQRAGD
jgi:NitT/TauT family transport system ATP-binding protein